MFDGIGQNPWRKNAAPKQKSTCGIFAPDGWENKDKWHRMTLHRGSRNQAFWSLLLAKVLLGKDEVAGSNPAISSIEILQNLAGFRFFIAVIVECLLAFRKNIDRKGECMYIYNKEQTEFEEEELNHE